METVEAALDTFLLIFAETAGGSATKAGGTSRIDLSLVFKIVDGGSFADTVRRSWRGVSKYPVASSGAVVGLDDCCCEVSERVLDKRLLPGAEDPKEDRRSGITITGILSCRFFEWSGPLFSTTSDDTLPLLIASGLWVCRSLLGLVDS